MSNVPEYRVVGNHSVFETAPGKTFKKSLDPAHEARLIDGGAIERVSRSSSKQVGEESAVTSPTGGPAAPEKE